ncbi:MAG TPA: sensor histidine kinase [Ktedonobacteraceae bacterium]
MRHKNITRKQNISTALQSPLKWSGLQARMTFSYVWLTIAYVLLLELLVILLVLIIIFFILYQRSNTFISTIEHTAQKDAIQITRQLTTTQLTALKLGDPNAPPSSGSINDNGVTIPYVAQRSASNQFTPFALLITPDGNIAVSSYPARYPIKTPATQLIPYATGIINTALTGSSEKGTIYATPSGYSAGIAVPIWSQQHIVGALYIEHPYIGLSSVLDILRPIGMVLLTSGLIALVFSAPIGGIFGLVTTRGLVRRLRNLITATTLFADGNYEQRVSVTRKDEIGQLEQQFNRMAEQLLESIAQRQKLAEQNARLAERSRISRELHDAISQDLFSLSMLAGGLQTALPHDSPLQTQISTLGATTTSTIREMRALLLELRPLQLEDLGLAEGLKELATSYITRLGITVNTEIAPVQLNVKAEYALLRISQEALANAVRHANATTITLSLFALKKHVTLTISDNGSGFNPDESKIQHGLGLRLMQERVQELNGTFKLQSTPGQGTSICVCLPEEHPCDSSLDCG